MTLIEVLTVVAILGTVAGAVMWSLDGHEEAAVDVVNGADLARIRDAAQRFHADLDGRAPLCLAELLVEPGAAFANWWWRGQAFAAGTLPVAPPSELAGFDPATGLGWRGPYLAAELWTAQSDGRYRDLVESAAVPGSTIVIDTAAAGHRQPYAILLNPAQHRRAYQGRFDLAVESDFALEWRGELGGHALYAVFRGAQPPDEPPARVGTPITLPCGIRHRP